MQARKIINDASESLSMAYTEKKKVSARQRRSRVTIKKRRLKKRAEPPSLPCNL